MDTSAKNVREHIARSKFFLQRKDLLKSLKSVAFALELLAAGQIVGRERIEIGILMEEAVRLLMEQEAIKRQFPNGLAYKKGRERELSGIIGRLAQTLDDALSKLRVEERRKRLIELDELMLTAQAELDQKNPLEARKLFRRAAESNGEEPGLYFDIGNRFLLAGLAAEAMEYLQRSIEAAPTDVRAYAALAQCHDALGEAEKAEDVLKNLVRRFGPDEGVLVRLAKGALERRNWNEALLNAQAVLKVNPRNMEGHRVASAASERVYGNAKAYLLEGGAKPAPEGPAPEIKLDF